MFGDFFLKLSRFLEQVNDLRIKRDTGEFEKQSFEELTVSQNELFYDLKEENYDKSVYNPDVLEKLCDKEFVSPLLSLSFEVRASLITVF